MTHSDIGRPAFWILEDHIKAIEGMIRADEIIIALEMCDKIPGYFRENYPPELTALKSQLFKRLYNQFVYSSDDEEAGISREKAEGEITSGYMYPRGEILRAHLDELAKLPVVPWIVDLGCSHGHLPMGLQKLGYSFNYLGLGMNYRAVQKIKEWLETGVWQDEPHASQRKILVCFETIEHMYDEGDLERGVKKLGVEFDDIFLSVPYGTLGGGIFDWNRPIGHVRTYTQQDFINLANKVFPGYQWALTVSHSLVLQGSR